MPWYKSDGLFWLVIATGTYIAYQRIPDTLNHVRNLAACPEQTGPGPRKQLQKDAEDATSIDTLRVLSEGYSYDLRAAAIKIVATRALKSRTKKLLLRDLASKDEDRRYKAICGLWMLLYNSALSGRHIDQDFVDFKSFRALITALRNVLADHDVGRKSHFPPSVNLLYPEPRVPPSPIKPPVRPTHELLLMMILRVLLGAKRPYDQLAEYPDNMTCALAAGLVSRWLKDYPFPCALPQNSKFNFKKHDVTELFGSRGWASDDVFMGGIIISINMNAIGRRQLREAGLCGASNTELASIENTVRRWRHMPPRLDEIDTDHDVRMTNGEDTAGAATPPPIALSRRHTTIGGEFATARSQEMSQEEENLRRRRREAVVVAEPGAPLSQDNILQRTDSGSAWQPPDQVLPQHGITFITSAEVIAYATSSEAEPPRSPSVVGEASTNPGDPWSSSNSTLSTEGVHEFSSLMQPFLAEQETIRSLQDDLNNRPDLDSDDFVVRIDDMLDRIREHRDRVREALDQQQDLPQVERDHLTSRLDRAVEDIAGQERADALLAILRERRPGTETGPANDQS